MATMALIPAAIHEQNHDVHLAHDVCAERFARKRSSRDENVTHWGPDQAERERKRVHEPHVWSEPHVILATVVRFPRPSTCWQFMSRMRTGSRVIECCTRADGSSWEFNSHELLSSFDRDLRGSSLLAINKTSGDLGPNEYRNGAWDSLRDRIRGKTSKNTAPVQLLCTYCSCTNNHNFSNATMLVLPLQTIPRAFALLIPIQFPARFGNGQLKITEGVRPHKLWCAPNSTQGCATFGTNPKQNIRTKHSQPSLLPAGNSRNLRYSMERVVTSGFCG